MVERMYLLQTVCSRSGKGLRRLRPRLYAVLFFLQGHCCSFIVTLQFQNSNSQKNYGLEQRVPHRATSGLFQMNTSHRGKRTIKIMPRKSFGCFVMAT